ncbi:MAG: imidazole glycerol phosphate synthase subunit HisH [Caldilineaceae bacterium]
MIAILDYGVGNLRSVYKAFETVAAPMGIPVDVVDRPTDLTRWRAVVLPGQGAFGDSVNNLRRQQLEQPLLDAVADGLPLLGICVGMQLLFDASEEMGQHEGLHLIPGQVRRFPEQMADPVRNGHTLRIPQIGWNQLHRRRRRTAGRRARRRLCLLRPLLFLRRGRSVRSAGHHRLRRGLSQHRALSQRLGHPAPPGEVAHRRPAHLANFMRMVAGDGGRADATEGLPAR